jgi:cytochrome c556
MRRVSIIIAVCVVLALGIGIMGQGRDLDAIMKDIGPLWGNPQAPGLNAAITNATPDYAKIAADAAKMQSLFAEAEGQFTKLKMTEAAGIAKGAGDAAGALAKEAKTGKIADAKAAAGSIGQCKTCHGKFRESDGAGGFKVKAQ